MSSSTWLLPAVAAVALGAVAWTMSRDKAARGGGGGFTLGFAQMPPPAPVPSPPEEPAAAEPTELHALLSAIVDTTIPAYASGHDSQTAVPYRDEEIRTIINNILERAKDRDTGGAWDLRLVAVDAVRKAVDPYKTLFYELTFLVYSSRRNVGIKLAATVVVPPSNAMYVKSLRSFEPATPPGQDHPRGSLGPGAEAVHAQWQPTLTGL